MNSGSGKPINRDTKIADLIKAHPLVTEELIKLNPNFKKLKNSFLRKMLAPRVSIAQACAIANSPLPDFFASMEAIGFEIEKAGNAPVLPADGQSGSNIPSNLQIVTLDVRPVLAGHDDPLKMIMDKIKYLEEGQALKVINTFEPVPLITLLAKKGFYHQVERVGAEEVNTYLYKAPNSVAHNYGQLAAPDEDKAFEAALKRYPANKMQMLDVRELPMPQPMAAILEAIKSLGEGNALFVYHKKVPAFLLPELKERGFRFLYRYTADEKVEMLIFK